MSRIQLAHGSGGRENQQLIEELFLAAFNNPILAELEDAAMIADGRLALSTDTFTVKPLFFPGGNIGKLAVAGTTNDLAMRGARPLYLTAAFIIEEGLEFSVLKDIVQAMHEELKVTGTRIVSGDTKVVPRGAVDQLMINTTGLGEILHPGCARNLAPGDRLLISGPMAQHGACIYAAREEIAVTGLESDCCSLWPAVEQLLNQDIPVHAMRDATRGGLGAVLNEWAQAGHCSLLLNESAVPCTDAVSGFCDMLGIDPYSLAGEGVFVLAVPPADASSAVEILRSGGHPHASEIGSVEPAGSRPRVVLKSAYATERLLEYPSGEILPRIC